jgi:hypothetical protein
MTWKKPVIRPRRAVGADSATYDGAMAVIAPTPRPDTKRPPTRRPSVRYLVGKLDCTEFHTVYPGYIFVSSYLNCGSSEEDNGHPLQDFQTK